MCNVDPSQGISSSTYEQLATAHWVKYDATIGGMLLISFTGGPEVIVALFSEQVLSILSSIYAVDEKRIMVRPCLSNLEVLVQLSLLLAGSLL